MTNPVKAAVTAIVAHAVPFDLVYRIDGEEIYRETATMAQLQKRGCGIEPYIAQVQAAGAEFIGPLRETALPDGGARLWCQVMRDDGQLGEFSVTMYAFSEEKTKWYYLKSKE